MSIWISIISGLSGASFVAAILWLFRNWITIRLSKSVEHDYDKKLVSLEASISRDLEEQKNELVLNRTKVDALRSTVLTGSLSRQDKLFEKQLDAAEKIWLAKCELAKLGLPSLSSEQFDWRVIDKSKTVHPGMQKFASSLFAGIEIDKFKDLTKYSLRPFLSREIWAYFSAYEAIIVLAVMRMSLLKDGITTNYIKTDNVNKLLRIALPDFAEVIDQHGEAVHHAMLEVLSEKLLNAIQTFLMGEERDGIEVEKFNSIIKAAEQVISNADQANTIKEKS